MISCESESERGPKTCTKKGDFKFNFIKTKQTYNFKNKVKQTKKKMNLFIQCISSYYSMQIKGLPVAKRKIINRENLLWL